MQSHPSCSRAAKWSLVYSLHFTFIHQRNLICTSKHHSKRWGAEKTEEEEEGRKTEREKDTEAPGSVFDLIFIRHENIKVK